MRVKSSVRTAGVLLVPLVAFFAWYYVAANYDYDALSGAYIFEAKGESCVLYLRSDTTFVQKCSLANQVKQARGYWRRYGEAGVSFSAGFLKLPGQEFDGSNAAFGEFEKTLGIFPRLTLAPLPGGPVLRKKWLF